MKLKNLALTLAAGSVVVATAKADTTFYINGSTAYRKATYAAIHTLYTTGAGNSLDVNYPIGDASSTATGSGTVVNSVGNGAANIVWSGTLAAQGLGHVVIVCNWAGSVSGQKNDAESDLWPTFLNPTVTAGSYPSGDPFVAQIPDMNMADNFQKTTMYFPPGDPSAVSLKATQVAVVDFLLCKDPSAPSDLTDVTSENLREMYDIGYMNLAQMTGVPGDDTSYVIPTGRDDDSGTRTIFEADNGIGFTDTLLQWGLHSTLVDGMSGYTPYQFSLTSINNNDGTGYSSGGTVATLLNDTTGPGSIPDPSGDTSGNVTSYFVGYVSVTDATGNNPTPVPTGQYLNYNGVAYSVNAIEHGQYTYWGYENLDIRPAHYTGVYKTLYNVLADPTSMSATGGEGSGQAAGLLEGAVATINGTIAIPSMDCSRNGDGGLIGHN